MRTRVVACLLEGLLTETRSRSLSSLPVIVPQSSTEPFLLLDRSYARWFWRNKHKDPDALVIAFGVIVHHEGTAQEPERNLADENKFAQVCRAYSAHESPSIGIQVRASRRASHRHDQCAVKIRRSCFCAIRHAV